MANQVLLIDDDTDEHELFSEQLTEYDKNFEVISAYNGLQAFRILEKISPYCIFLDINMPIMNGLQVLKKLKGDERLKDIPVYVYSTSDGYNSKKPAIKLGALDYFQKPESSQELGKIFKSVFGV